MTAQSVDLRLFTAPTAPASASLDLLSQVKAEAYPSFLPAKHEVHPLGVHEANKRKTIEKYSGDTFINSHAALLKAILDMGLESKRLAVDEPFTASILKRANILDVSSNGENMLRSIRLRKSPAEIELMRYAANANAEAGPCGG